MKRKASGMQRFSAAATALIVAAAVLAGCGGSGSGSNSDSGTATESVVKIGTISPVGTAVGNWPTTTAAMKAAARQINANGGINGHNVEIVACNGGVDPNQAINCAREMVSEGVIATVRDIINSNPASAATVTKILGKASISEVFSIPRTPSQYAAKNLFPADGSSTFLYGFGAYAAAKRYDAKSLAVAAFDSPLANIGLSAIRTAARNAGVPIKGIVKVPVDLPDYAPLATQIVGTGADAVVLVLSPAQIAQMVPAIRANGGQNLRLMAQKSVISPSIIEQLGSAGNGLTVISTLPPLSAADEFPGLAEFLRDMKAEADAGNPDAQADKLSSVDVLGWLGVHAVAEVAKKKNLSTIDAESVLAAMQEVEGLDLKGLIEDWSPGATGPIEGFSNVTHLSFYTSEVRNGETALTTDTPIDGTPALTGTWSTAPPP